MTEDVAWLAGLLEGEGCFSLDKRRGANYPMVGLNMADRDVVERAATIMRSISESPAKVSRKKVYHGEQQWRISLAAGPAERLMRELLPRMGKRRRARITEILEARRKVA